MSRALYRLVVAAFIAVVLFILGFMLGSQVVQSKISQLQDTQNAIQVDTLSLEIESQLQSENPCSSANLEALGHRLEQLGPKLDFLEGQARDNTELASLKKYYSLLEIKHWLAIKGLNKNCNKNFAPILYFYSNNGCNKCSVQGSVLLTEKEKNPRLMIYSFDVDLDLSAIKILKTEYNINSVPAVVIFDKKYEGLQDANELGAILQPVQQAVLPDNAAKAQLAAK
jgi:cell division protein FtsB